MSNSMNSRRFAVLALSLCALLFGQPAGAKATYVTFDAWFVKGINGSSTVTGGSANLTDSFVRTVDGTITTFAVPGASWTEATSINDAGLVAGEYRTREIFGFVRAVDGTITTFKVPHSKSGTIGVSAINDKDGIVGDYYDENSDGHGFERRPDGKFRTVDVSGPRE